MRMKLLILLCALLVPSFAHAVIYYDDEVESASSLFHFQPHFDAGTYTYDSGVKFSGNGSLRLNFPPNCQTLTTQGQCGGALGELHAPTTDLYQRYYFRMSGAGPQTTNSGVFEVAAALTKMMNTVSNVSNGLFARSWTVMGCCGSKALLLEVENAPTTGRVTVVSTSITLQDNRWYCIETRQKLNTPGLPDGIATIWVDGNVVGSSSTINYRRAGSTVLWEKMGPFRQIGIGNMWYDRIAAANQRIGCIGSPAPQDTTPPTGATNLVVQ